MPDTLKTNWTGRGLQTAAGYGAARSPSDAIALVNQAIARGAPVRALAGRYSDTAVLHTRGLQVNVVGMRVGGAWTRPYDPTLLRPGLEGRAKYLVEVGAGATVQRVCEELAGRGLGLPMTGAFSGQTLVGAILTSTHGTGLAHGPLATRVRSIEVVVARPGGAQLWRIEAPGARTISDATKLAARGVTLRGTSPAEKDWLDALVVSIGAMGVVTSVVVEAVDAFRLRAKSTGMRWRDAKALLASPASPATNGALHGCSFLINAYSGDEHGEQTCALTEYSVVVGPDPALPRRRGGAPACAGDIGQAVEMAIPTRHHIASNLAAFAIRPPIGQTTEGWNDSYRLLTGDNPYPKGTSIEYAFPIANYLEAVDAMLRKLRTLHDAEMSCVGPVSLRFVGPTDALLGVTHGGPRATVEVLAALGKSTVAMHHGDDALGKLSVVAFKTARDGRPHWGQRLPGNLPAICARYPRYARWKAARDALDPMGLFRNLPWP